MKFIRKKSYLNRGSGLALEQEVLESRGKILDSYLDQQRCQDLFLVQSNKEFYKCNLVKFYMYQKFWFRKPCEVLVRCDFVNIIKNTILKIFIRLSPGHSNRVVSEAKIAPTKKQELKTIFVFMPAILSLLYFYYIRSNNIKNWMTWYFY